MKPRIIVCCLGSTGYQIFCLLRQQGASVVGVGEHLVPGEETGIIVGDPRSAATLLAAGIRDADAIAIASDDDAVNLAILMQARLLNPKIRIITRLFNGSLGDRLDRTLPQHTSMSVSTLAAPIFAFAAMGSRAIGHLTLFNETWPIHEEYIDQRHPWNGRKLAELWEDPRRMLIYYLPQHPHIDLVSAVLTGKTLEVGDRLIVATQLSKRHNRRSWGRKFQESLGNWRRFQQQNQATTLALLALLLTILTATFTYTIVNTNTSFVDSLYFSVGMITGAGGNEAVAEHSPVPLKLFTALMMLVGAGAVGICYALLNDFILGSRLRQLWDTPEIPHRHHYIVCGLGDIGIKAIEQLHSNGYDVVVIDRDPNCRFLSTAQGLKIPVIQADATLPASLKAAHIEKAEAVLAVTSNDMTNLEIALTAKGVVPQLPLVVRSEDPRFALMVQQVFDFEHVLNPTEIAAPAFAAAAIGGRILGNGMTAGSLWVAIATLITPAHPFYHQTVQESAMKADFVPLYIQTPEKTIHGWELLETSLEVGDVLYLTIPGNKLELLWRTTPSKLISSSSS
ncbi:potassium channel family protein [Laspinema olomoucense]|uniref:potassium channel family protein n=1 Tax=Laspinema olomoucense TaxID=3231600 RepID=UPI0021BA4F37|nr:NAD-binding protein [Laspinema sp. D3c]MCT7997350.1 NAD-binding protein [Laspinema sp. D3c]